VTFTNQKEGARPRLELVATSLWPIMGLASLVLG